MNEITIKYAPRFAGMENRSEYEKVTTELALAKVKHPNVCKDITPGDQDDAYYFKAEREAAQTINDVYGYNASGNFVLLEEVYEALEAAAKCEWQNAYTEFAQVAVVAIRLMEKVRREHLERKDGEE